MHDFTHRMALHSWLITIRVVGLTFQAVTPLMVVLASTKDLVFIVYILETLGWMPRVCLMYLNLIG